MRPGRLDRLQAGGFGQEATGGRVRNEHHLAGAGQDSGCLGHEVHAAEDDVTRVGADGVLGQFEAVAAEVGELDNFVTLVMVAQDDEGVTQSRFEI